MVKKDALQLTKKNLRGRSNEANIFREEISILCVHYMSHVFKVDYHI